METTRIFLREVDGDNDILVTNKANFEQVNLCETFGDYGQKVTCYNAGCYSFENSSCSIFDDFYEAISSRFGIGANMDDIDEGNFTKSDLVELLIENDTQRGSVYFGEVFAKMVLFFNTWKTENENHSPCVAYTYWDGNNFATAVISNEYFDDQVSHVEIEEKEAKLVEEAIENRSFVKEGFGKNYYEYGEYYVIESFWQGAWFGWQVIKKDEIEL